MITAVLRVHNEIEWLPYCIESIRDIFDEIIIVMQGKQTDGTLEWVIDNHVGQYYLYPWMSHPNGPGYSRHPWDRWNRAFFYQWCFDKAKTPWVCKWDADMIALPRAKEVIRSWAATKSGALGWRGANLAGDIYRLSRDYPYTTAEPRLYLADKGWYETGEYCERMALSCEVTRSQEVLFLHTKFLKESSRAAWPDNWQEIPHFQGINARFEPGGRYEGAYPKCMEEMLWT